MLNWLGYIIINLTFDYEICLKLSLEASNNMKRIKELS